MRFSTNSRGVSVIGLMGSLAIASLMALFLQARDTALKFSANKLRDSRYAVTFQSSIETMLLAYRLAESSYNVQLSKCTSEEARPFLEALSKGHGCATGLNTVTVFRSTDGEPSKTDVTGLLRYAHSGGCTISRNLGLRCGPGQTPPPVAVVQIGGETSSVEDRVERLDQHVFSISLSAAYPEREVVEFVSTMKRFRPEANGSEKQTLVARRAFAIRGTFANAAHVEFDGRVTSEFPDPTSRCPSNSWGPLNVFDEVTTHQCEQFVRLGGGRGLAMYKDRYFGFRPSDGTVVDMLAAATSESYRVDPISGKTCGTCAQIFPAYSPVELHDAADITLIDDGIYYARGFGTGSVIGVLATDGFTRPSITETPNRPGMTNFRIPLCPLGDLGWAQQIRGLAATSWSDSLLPTDDEPERMRMATFFVKTSSGTLLTATVRSAPVDGTFQADPACTKFQRKGKAYWSCCTVFKDINLQAIEYTRTFGFDRSAGERPYYIY